MALKVAVIGAGSVGFTRKLMRDILSVPELTGHALRVDRHLATQPGPGHAALSEGHSHQQAAGAGVGHHGATQGRCATPTS